MFWFDNSKFFKRMFVPHDDGYLVYPGRNRGGKFVSRVEYESLVANFRRWWGGRFWWGWGFLIMFAIMIAGVVLMMLLGLSDSWSGPFGLVLAAGFLPVYFWALRAPYRLVSGRPDCVPPRTREELQRHIRSVTSWPLLIGALIFIGFLLWITFQVPEHPLGWWLWTAAITAMLAKYLHLAWRKLQDSRDQ